MAKVSGSKRSFSDQGSTDSSVSANEDWVCLLRDQPVREGCFSVSVFQHNSQKESIKIRAVHTKKSEPPLSSCAEQIFDKMKLTMECHFNQHQSMDTIIRMITAAIKGHMSDKLNCSLTKSTKDGNINMIINEQNVFDDSFLEHHFTLIACTMPSYYHINNDGIKLTKMTTTCIQIWNPLFKKPINSTNKKMTVSGWMNQKQNLLKLQCDQSDPLVSRFISVFSKSDLINIGMDVRSSFFKLSSMIQAGFMSDSDMIQCSIVDNIPDDKEDDISDDDNDNENEGPSVMTIIITERSFNDHFRHTLILQRAELTIEDKLADALETIKNLRTKLLNKNPDQLAIKEMTEMKKENALLRESLFRLRNQIKPMEEKQRIMSEYLQSCQESQRKLETELELQKSNLAQVSSERDDLKKKVDSLLMQQSSDIMLDNHHNNSDDISQSHSSSLSMSAIVSSKSNEVAQSRPTLMIPLEYFERYSEDAHSLDDTRAVITHKGKNEWQNAQVAGLMGNEGDYGVLFSIESTKKNRMMFGVVNGLETKTHGQFGKEIEGIAYCGNDAKLWYPVGWHPPTNYDPGEFFGFQTLKQGDLIGVHLQISVKQGRRTVVVAWTKNGRALGGKKEISSKMDTTQGVRFAVCTWTKGDRLRIVSSSRTK